MAFVGLGRNIPLVDLGPPAGAGNEAVTRVGKDGASKRLRSGPAEGLKNDEGANSVEETTSLAKGVVENLRDGLRRGQNLGRVAHAEGQDNVVEETANVGKSHGGEDAPGRLDLGLVDSVASQLVP